MLRKEDRAKYGVDRAVLGVAELWKFMFLNISCLRFREEAALARFINF